MIKHNFVAKHLRFFNKAKIEANKKKDRKLNRQKNNVALRCSLKTLHSQ